MTKVPYLTAELGGGLQMTYKRRPVATGKDIAAMSIAKLGSGCSLLGYYMYHGGTNPDGKLTSMQETTASGSFCDLLEKNYDFRAPLGEYGAASESYRYLRRLALFIHDYGEELAGMDTYIPKDNPDTPFNFTDLRYSLRYNRDTRKGFLFVNNYQRRNELLDHYDAHIHFEEPVKIDDYIDITNGEFLIYSVNGSKIEKAIPLCKLHERDIVYYLPKANLEKVEGVEYLSDADSLNISKLKTREGREFLINTDGIVYTECKGDDTIVYLETSDSELQKTPGFTVISVYPTSIETPAGFRKSKAQYEHLACGDNGERITDIYKFRYNWTASLPEAPKIRVEIEEGGKRIIHVDAWHGDRFNILHDVFLNIPYTGNCARLYLGDKLVADDLYSGVGHEWHVGLRRFGKEALDFRLEVDPLKKDAPIYIEKWPEMGPKDSCFSIDKITASRVFRNSFKI